MKKAVIILTALLLCLPLVYAAPWWQSNQIGYWQFTEINTTKATDTWNGFNMSATGTLASADNYPVYGTSGAGSSYSRTFGQTGATDRFQGTTGRFNMTNQSYTISAWFYPISLNGTGLGIIDTRSSSAGGQRIAISNDSGGSYLQMQAITPSAASNITKYKIDDTYLNRWNHVVFIRNASSVGSNLSKVEGLLFVNGVLVNRTAGFSAGVTTSSATFFIGNNNGVGAAFNGSIDDVAWWNRSLMASEVLDLYNYGAYQNGTDAWQSVQSAGGTGVFQLNVSTNTTYLNMTSATLYINGSAYTATKTNTSSLSRFDASVVLPNIGGTLFSYWNYSINGYTYVTDTRSTVLTIPQIDNCAVLTTRWVNYTTRDEVTTNKINTSMSYTFNYTSGNYSGVYSGNETNANNFDFCMTPNGASFNTNILLQYSASSYQTRTYNTINTVVDNSTDQINLYLLSLSNVTTIALTTSDSSGTRLGNILIEAYSYNVANDSYNLVQTEFTDSDGTANFGLIANTQYYKFKFYQGSSLVLETIRFKLFLTSYPYVLTARLSNILTSYLSTTNGVTRSLTYTNSSKLVNLTYTVTRPQITSICLNVTTWNTTYSSTCSSAATDSLTYTITTLNESYNAYAYAIENNQAYLLDSLGINTRYTLTDLIGRENSLWISFLIMALFFPIGYFSVSILLFIEAVLISLLYLFGLLAIPFYVVGGIIVLLLVLLGIIERVRT